WSLILLARFTFSSATSLLFAAFLAFRSLRRRIRLIAFLTAISSSFAALLPLLGIAALLRFIAVIHRKCPRLRVEADSSDRYVIASLSRSLLEVSTCESRRRSHTLPCGRGLGGSCRSHSRSSSEW